MANREIKTKLTLDGEQEFRQGMSEAARSVTSLQDELKLCEAQYKATGDAQTYWTDKISILEQQLAAQEQAVETAKQAMAALKEQGFDESDKTYQKWSETLTKAETKFYNIQSALNDAQSAFQTSTAATEELSGATETANTNVSNLDNSLSSVGKQFSLQTVIDGLSAVDEMISGTIGKITELSTALADTMRESASWADNILTQSSIAMFDPETYQAMLYTSRFVDTEVSTIITAQQRIANTMKDWDLRSKDAKTEIYWQNLGVSTRNADESLKNSQEVFWQTIDLLHDMGDGYENLAAKEQLASLVFGRSWRQLNPLIDAGREAYDAYMDEARQLSVVSDDNVRSLGVLDDNYQRLEAQMEKLKETTTAELAPAFQTITESLSTIVTKAQEFAESEAGKKALEGLSDAIERLFTSFAEDLDFEGILSTITGLIDGLTKGLQWIADNSQTVVTALELIAGAFAAIKISEGVLTFIKTIQGWKGLTGGGAAGAAGGGGAGAGGAAGGSKLLAGVGTVATEAMATGVLPVIGGAFAVHQLGSNLSAAAVERDYGDYNRTIERVDDLLTQPATDAAQSMTDISPAAAQATEALEKLQAALGEAVASVEVYKDIDNEEGVQPLRSYISANLGDVRQATADADIWKRLDEAVKAAQGSIEGSYEEIAAKIVESGNLTSTAEEWLLVITQYITDLGTKIDEAKAEAERMGTETSGGLEAGLQEGAAGVEQAGAEVGQAGVDGIQTTASAEVAGGLGSNFGGGFASGISSQLEAVGAAAAAIAQKAVTTVQSGLKIASPSRVMRDMGAFVSQGFAEGVESSLWRVERAVAPMSQISIDAATGAVGYGAPSRGSAAASAGAGTPGIDAVIMMDKTIVGRMTAAEVNRVIGTQIVSRR